MVHFCVANVLFQYNSLYKHVDIDKEKKMTERLSLLDISIWITGMCDFYMEQVIGS